MRSAGKAGWKAAWNMRAGGMLFFVAQQLALLALAPKKNDLHNAVAPAAEWFAAGRKTAAAECCNDKIDNTANKDLTEKK
ncbi:hypothetical protein [Undibacterium sp. Ren11W]|uniref:hypothetical protein n=1 Tax=Undibacterium sp. Ren11W TaxID=3413045 RepID=UPI003BF25043